MTHGFDDRGNYIPLLTLLSVILCCAVLVSCFMCLLVFGYLCLFNA